MPPHLGLGGVRFGGGGGASAPWYESILALSPVVLLDASTPGGVVLNGSNVEQLTDLSGHGNHFTASATPTNYQPPYNPTGINGLPTVDTRAAGAQKILTCVNTAASILNGLAATRVIVFQAIAAASSPGSGLFEEGFGGPIIQGTYLPYLDGNFYDQFYSTVRKTVGLVNNESAPIVYTTTVSAATPDFTAYVNGSQFYTDSASIVVGDGAINPTILGPQVGSNLSYWSGQLSFYAVFSYELDTVQLAALQAALAGRFL